MISKVWVVLAFDVSRLSRIESSLVISTVVNKTALSECIKQKRLVKLEGKKRLGKEGEISRVKTRTITIHLAPTSTRPKS